MHLYSFLAPVLLAMASKTAALPVAETAHTPGIQTFPKWNTTMIVAVDEPQIDLGSKLLENIKELPKCYQKCFRSEAHFYPGDLENKSLDQFCHKTWHYTVDWVLFHLNPCVRNNCQLNMDMRQTAFDWRVKYCGSKIGDNWITQPAKRDTTMLVVADEPQIDLGSKVLDNIEELPECHQKCFRSEAHFYPGKLENKNLDQFCHKTWHYTVDWVLFHLNPCLRNNCQQNDDMRWAAFNWRVKHCGSKIGDNWMTLAGPNTTMLLAADESQVELDSTMLFIADEPEIDLDSTMILAADGPQTDLDSKVVFVADEEPQIDLGSMVFDNMEELPECYQKCFRSEAHFYPGGLENKSLDQFCHKTWHYTVDWVLFHLYPCTRNNCRALGSKAGYGAYDWRRKYCGSKIGDW